MEAVEKRLSGILETDWKSMAVKILDERRRTGSGEVSIFCCAFFVEAGDGADWHWSVFYSCSSSERHTPSFFESCSPLFFRTSRDGEAMLGVLRPGFILHLITRCICLLHVTPSYTRSILTANSISYVECLTLH